MLALLLPFNKVLVRRLVPLFPPPRCNIRISLKGVEMNQILSAEAAMARAIELARLGLGKTFPNPITGKVEETYKMVDKNPNEHWYDHVGHMKHEERIQEGLELFGKHFRNLWD